MKIILFFFRIFVDGYYAAKELDRLDNVGFRWNRYGR